MHACRSTLEDPTPEDEDEQRAPARPRSFVVRLRDGRRLKARLLGRDAGKTLAFLRITDEAAGSTSPDAPQPPPKALDLPFVSFADGRVAPGDPVLLVELLPERYGFAPSFRRATVSSVVEHPRRLYDVDAFLQDSTVGTPVLDAAGRAIGLVVSDPIGDSGGPLTSALKVIGTLSRQKEPGFPMVLPADELDELLAHPPSDADDRHQNAWLGVTLQPVTRTMAEYLHVPPPAGVMITSVWPASPAEKAGLQVEDVIVAFDARPVEATGEDELPAFIDRVQRWPVDTPVDLRVYRRGEARTVTATPAAAPKTAVKAEEYRSSTFGLVAQDLTLDISMSREWPDTVAGALVSEVETAGWAQVGGIQRGDLIQAVDGVPVKDVADLKQRLEKAESDRKAEVVFFVLRDPDTLFIPVKTAW